MNVTHQAMDGTAWFSDGGITGTCFRIKQARVEMLTDEVIAIDKLTDFTIITNKNTYEAKQFLLATNNQDKTHKNQRQTTNTKARVLFLRDCDFDKKS